MKRRIYQTDLLCIPDSSGCDQYTNSDALIARKNQNENLSPRELRKRDSLVDMMKPEDTKLKISLPVSERYIDAMVSGKDSSVWNVDIDFVSKKDLNKLPIVNIDILDQNDPKFATVYVNEMYQHFKQAERQNGFINPNYLNRAENQLVGGEAKRRCLVNMMLNLSRKMNFLPSTIYLAVYIIDQFFSRALKPIVSGDDLILIGVTALMIAFKYEQVGKFRLEKILSYLQGSAANNARRNLIFWENRILGVIDYQLTVPTVNTFLSRYLRFGELSSTMGVPLACCIGERALMEYSLLKYPPSILAATAILLSRSSTEHESPPWTAALQRSTGYSVNALMDCAVEIKRIMLDETLCRSISYLREDWLVHLRHSVENKVRMKLKQKHWDSRTVKNRDDGKEEDCIGKSRGFIEDLDPYNMDLITHIRQLRNQNGIPSVPGCLLLDKQKPLPTAAERASQIAREESFRYYHNSLLCIFDESALQDKRKSIVPFVPLSTASSPHASVCANEVQPSLFLSTPTTVSVSLAQRRIPVVSSAGAATRGSEEETEQMVRSYQGGYFNKRIYAKYATRQIWNQPCTPKKSAAGHLKGNVTFSNAIAPSATTVTPCQPDVGENSGSEQKRKRRKRLEGRADTLVDISSPRSQGIRRASTSLLVNPKDASGKEEDASKAVLTVVGVEEGERDCSSLQYIASKDLKKSVDDIDIEEAFDIEETVRYQVQKEMERVQQALPPIPATFDAVRLRFASAVYRLMITCPPSVHPSIQSKRK